MELFRAIAVFMHEAGGKLRERYGEGATSESLQVRGSAPPAIPAARGTNLRPPLPVQVPTYQKALTFTFVLAEKYRVRATRLPPAAPPAPHAL